MNRATVLTRRAASVAVTAVVAAGGVLSCAPAFAATPNYAEPGIAAYVMDYSTATVVQDAKGSTLTGGTVYRLDGATAGTFDEYCSPERFCSQRINLPGGTIVTWVRDDTTAPLVGQLQPNKSTGVYARIFGRSTTISDAYPFRTFVVDFG
jgi:hypothetical protein